MSDPNLSLQAAFLQSNYGTAQERAYLSPVSVGFCPTWATGPQVYTIITAYNPNGEQSSHAANAQAQARLQADLSGWRVLHGHNGAGPWQEKTLLVAGLELLSARYLGQRYHQAAVVVGLGERAALLWCGSGRAEWLYWSGEPYKLPSR